MSYPTLEIIKTSSKKNHKNLPQNILICRYNTGKKKYICRVFEMGRQSQYLTNTVYEKQNYGDLANLGKKQTPKQEKAAYEVISKYFPDISINGDKRDGAIEISTNHFNTGQTLNIF